MSSQNLCSSKDELANLVLEAQRIVFWAGSLVEDGEQIGGIGQQQRRASRLLRLHDGVVWRAWYARAGPEIFPTIWEARNSLIERLARSRSSPWRSDVQLRGLRSERNPSSEIRKTRSVTRAPSAILPTVPESPRSGTSPGKIQSEPSIEPMVGGAKRNRRASMA